MSLNDLISLLPKPNNARGVPNKEVWRLAESQLSEFPSDYKDFLETYGTGIIDQFLYIYNPASENTFLNLVSQARKELEGLREMNELFPTRFPMKPFPEPGGFLPFGGTENGDTLFWVTNDSVADWTIAVMGPRSPECFRFDGGIIAFLCQLLSRQITCDIFPKGFPSSLPIKFEAV